MKISVIGATGLLGSKLVQKICDNGQELLATSADSVTNAPSSEDTAVLKFFETSTRNLPAYGAAAVAGHYLALSVVGTERLLEIGYFRAKLAAGEPDQGLLDSLSIIRATQFFEFVKQIAGYPTEGSELRRPPALIQPMAADDTNVQRV